MAKKQADLVRPFDPMSDRDRRILLEKLLFSKESVFKKAVNTWAAKQRRLLNDLLEALDGDIYTDAPEQRGRVERVHLLRKRVTDSFGLDLRVSGTAGTVRKLSELSPKTRARVAAGLKKYGSLFSRVD